MKMTNLTLDEVYARIGMLHDTCKAISVVIVDKDNGLHLLHHFGGTDFDWTMIAGVSVLNTLVSQRVVSPDIKDSKS